MSTDEYEKGEDDVDNEEVEEEEDDLNEEDDVNEDDVNEEHEEQLLQMPQQQEYSKKRRIQGNDLHVLLQNLDKLPTPPPTNNHRYAAEKYRFKLINYLKTINNPSEFTRSSELFTFVDVGDGSVEYSSSSLLFTPLSIPAEPFSDTSQNPAPSSSLSQKSALSFILNEDEDNGHSMVISSDESRKVTTDWDDIEPSSLIDLPTEEFAKKQGEACEFITKKIINIYESTIKDQLKSEIIRRDLFKNLIMLLDYYEKLEVFCNLNLIREKRKTVKSQATQMIIRSSKLSYDKPPQIKEKDITVIVGQATRMRRLLNIASNDYNIFYAFPDLKAQLFLPKKLGVVNYERWLKLVETGVLPSFKKGEQLYEEYKEEYKKKRLENFNFLK